MPESDAGHGTSIIELVATQSLGASDFDHKSRYAPSVTSQTRHKRRRRIVLICAVVFGVLIALAVGLTVGVAARTAARNRYDNNTYNPLQYVLVHEYSGITFFDEFNYFSGNDPTYGFVEYVPQHVATSLNLTSVSSAGAVIRVDSIQNSSSNGRNSVRLTSKVTYNQGLFLFDVAHAPVGCGAWPALWLADPNNWPQHGEIDVYETTNLAIHGNQVTLHTAAGCDMTGVARKMTGSPLYTTCLNSTNHNDGCGVMGSQSSAGEYFNAANGGVYALEISVNGIRVWLLQHNDIPPDVQNGTTPQPSTWGLAVADFPSTSCDIGSHFQNMSIIINIDLCSWASEPYRYATLDQCPGSCQAFVASNGDKLQEVFWTIRSIRVYQLAVLNRTGLAF